MAILRFIFFLLAPVLEVLAIPFLIALYLIGFIALGLHNTWLRATRSPDYDPYWDVF